MLAAASKEMPAWPLSSLSVWVISWFWGYWAAWTAIIASAIALSYSSADCFSWTSICMFVSDGGAWLFSGSWPASGLWSAYTAGAGAASLAYFGLLTGACYYFEASFYAILDVYFSSSASSALTSLLSAIDAATANYSAGDSAFASAILTYYFEFSSFIDTSSYTVGGLSY